MASKSIPFSGHAFASGSTKPEQISYLSVPGEFELLDKTVGQLVDFAADQYGELLALFDVEANKRLSFIDNKNESNKFAAGLLKIGLKPGDRIGIWGPNSYKWLIANLASAKAGLISVFINPAFQPRELQYSLNKVGMKAIVIAGNFKTQDYYKMLVEVVPEIETAHTGQVKSDTVSLTTVITMEEKQRGKETFTYSQILSEGDSNVAQEILSSISLGIQCCDVWNDRKSKSVMLSHHNIVNNSYLIGKRFQLSSVDKICLPVPLFHCYGTIDGILVAIHFGAGSILPSPGFNASAAVQAVALEKCTLLYGTPTMHVDMMNIPDIQKCDLSSLRMAVTSGSSCPMEVIRNMKNIYTVDNVASLYGATECSPVIMQSLPSDSHEQRVSTVGYPLEHTEVKLVDADGKTVPLGTKGEMCARGYLVMRGYWDDLERTAEVIDSDGWYHTGDLLVMSETGHATVVGRVKDTIIRGGENIYPKEIEEFLHTHPSIVEAHVFGVPDKRLGEVVATWLRLKEGSKLTPEDVKSFCKGQISHFKIPQYVIFTNDFPKTGSGKIQKFRMREKSIQDLGLEAN